MRAWAFFLSLCLSASVALPGAQALPPSVAVLLPSYSTALENFERCKKKVNQLEEAALPHVERVRELKSKKSSWLRDFTLRRKLTQLQENLAQLSAARAALASAREDLFLQLSALEEELRASLEKELENRSGAKIQNWLEAKRLWDIQLEELGFNESKPFELVEVPRQAPTLQILADQKKALEARGIQLEAWADMLVFDLRMWKRLGSGNFVPKKTARARIAELEGLSGRVAELIRKNEAQRLANRPQKK